MKITVFFYEMLVLVILASFSNPAYSIKCDSSNKASPIDPYPVADTGWVQTWGTTVDQGSCDVEFVAQSHDGYVYTVGNFHRIIDFDPTDGEFTRGIDQSGGSIYISKFDTEGKYLWTRTFDGRLGYGLNGLGINSAGDIFLCGKFTEAADFDPGSGEAIRQAPTSTGQNYLVKLNQDCEFQWVRTWVGNRDFHFVIGSNDLVYVGGKQTLASVERNNEALRYDMATETDIAPFEEDTSFILTFNNDGNNIDILTWQNSDNDSININDIVVSMDGTLYVAGDFTDSMNLAPSGDDISTSSLGETDAFITVISHDRSEIWSKTWGSAMRDSAESIALNSVGEILVGGIFDSSVDFDPGDGEYILESNGALDCYVNQLDPDGNFIKAVAWGGVGFELGTNLYVDRDDNVLAWGSFRSVTDFDPGELENVRGVIGHSDGFLVKFNPDLNFQWVYTLGMCDIDSVIADDANNIYVGGHYNGTVDFDPSESVDERFVFHYLADTSYLMKLLPNGGWTEDYTPKQSIEPSESAMSTEASLGPEDYQNVVVVKSANLDSATQPVNQPVMTNPEPQTRSMEGWVDTFGLEREDIIEGLGVDSLGNAYILSGQGGGAFTSGHDPTLRKYSPDGNLEWMRENRDTPLSCLFVDDNGDSYVGSARYTRTTITTDSFYAATITRYDINGDIDSMQSIGRNGKSSIDAVYVTDSGLIYIGGFFTTTEDFDLGEDVHELTPSSGKSAFVAMYSNDFQFMWAATWAGRYWVSGTNLCVDSVGGVYISGHMIEDNPARSSATYTSTNFDTVNSYIRKFSWDGKPEWAYVFDNPTKCYLPAMAMDNEGSPYLCGYYSGLLDADPGAGVFELNSNEADALIVKMNSAGIFQWAKTISGEYIQEATGIAISPDNRIFITGDFQNEVDFDPGDGEFLMVPPGHDREPRSMNGYLCIFTLDGEFLNATQLSGTGGWNRGAKIAVDANGNILWAGTFIASQPAGCSLDFDPGEDEDLHTSQGYNLNDVFIVKYSPDLTW